jgi:glutathione S-transferase
MLRFDNAPGRSVAPRAGLKPETTAIRWLGKEDGSMQSHFNVALVTLLAAAAYFWMATRVARTRQKAGIPAPAMTGDPVLERTIRAHLNTLEWLPIFLPSLWLFAVYWNSDVAAALGLAWIVGRIVYFVGYVSEPRKRFPGFFIQSCAAALLLVGAMGRIAYLEWFATAYS